MIRVLVLLLLLVGPWFVVAGLASVARDAWPGDRPVAAAATGLAVAVVFVWLSWVLSAPVIVDGLDAPLFGGWW